MLKTTITSIGMPADWIKGRNGLRAMTRQALQQTIAYWHKYQLPGHFKAGAKRRYDYRQREESTMIRKQRYARKTGRSEARYYLVWSGRLRREVSRSIRISGTGKRARGIIRGPRYLYMYSKGGDRPFLGGEITAVDASDVQELVSFLDKKMTRAIQSNRQKTTRQV